MKPFDIINTTDDLEREIKETLSVLDSENILEIGIFVKGKKDETVRKLAKLLDYNLENYEKSKS